MPTKAEYMNRCLELAEMGAGNVAPNPMVGCVIVYNNSIIGEGYHQEHGGPHAEVNAILSVKNKDLLNKSTLYVTLEPCAHHGLTPPCSDLIIEKKIPHVVIGTVDPFARVAGRGIEKLKGAGIKVETGILENECRELNKRFFTFHEKGRPYVILKWAQTLDGFIDIDRSPEEFGEPTWITGSLALRLVHKIRAQEDAILVGRKTAMKDDPSLSVRHWAGENPVRAVIDCNLQLPGSIKLMDQSQTTLVFNSKSNEKLNNTIQIKIDFEKNIVPQILSSIHNRNLHSLIVEGGKQLLESFIESDSWDEAHIFIGSKFFRNGTKAPLLQGKIFSEEILDDDRLIVFKK